MVQLELGRPRPARPRLHDEAARAPARASCLPPPPVPRGLRSVGLRAARRLVVPRRWPPDDAPRLERAADGWDVPQRARDRCPRTTRRARGGRLLPDALQRTPRRCDVHAADATFRCELGARPDDGRPRDRARAAGGAGAHRGAGDRPLGHAAQARHSVTEFRATYRLMFGAGFGFREARALVPYLADLGVSHLYLPPSFQARQGSTHGYDVIDPTSISEEFGGDEAFRALAADAHAHGLGIVLDIVPNHMAVDDDNRYWADPELRTKFFDIDPDTGRHRRFFDIDHLAGVRQEDPEVFAETHRLAIALVRDGVVDGLRIDHPDGLADPAGYLARLRAEGVEHAWVEKILDPGEKLRPDWPVDGTVGYEFLNDLAALFVDRSGQPALDALWQEISGDTRAFADLAFEAKLEQASGTFRGDVERLASDLHTQQGARPPVAPDFGIDGLAGALSSLPVYRTYVDPRDGKVADEDRQAIAEAGIPEPLARILLLDD